MLHNGGRGSSRGRGGINNNGRRRGASIPGSGFAPNQNPHPRRPPRNGPFNHHNHNPNQQGQDQQEMEVDKQDQPQQLNGRDIPAKKQ